MGLCLCIKGELTMEAYVFLNMDRTVSSVTAKGPNHETMEFVFCSFQATNQHVRI